MQARAHLAAEHGHLDAAAIHDDLGSSHICEQEGDERN